MEETGIEPDLDNSPLREMPPWTPPRTPAHIPIQGPGRMRRLCSRSAESIVTLAYFRRRQSDHLTEQDWVEAY